MDLDSPVNLLHVSGREQLLGFNEYLARAEAWQPAMPTPGFWKDMRRLGGVKDNSEKVVLPHFQQTGLQVL